MLFRFLVLAIGHYLCPLQMPLPLFVFPNSLCNELSAIQGMIPGKYGCFRFPASSVALHVCLQVDVIEEFLQLNQPRSLAFADAFLEDGCRLLISLSSSTSTTIAPGLYSAIYLVSPFTSVPLRIFY